MQYRKGFWKSVRFCSTPGIEHQRGADVILAGYSACTQQKKSLWVGLGEAVPMRAPEAGCRSDLVLLADDATRALAELMVFAVPAAEWHQQSHGDCSV